MIKYTLADWLVYFKIVPDINEAKNLCFSGKVRINGQPCSNYEYKPRNLDIITSLDDNYSYQIPA